MQSKKSISAFILFFMLVFGLKAQNGNAVISEVRAYDLGNGMARLEVRVSGNLASSSMSATFTATKADGGGATVTGFLGGSRPVPNGNANDPVILSGNFLYTPSGEHPEFYEFDIQLNTTPRGNRQIYGEVMSLGSIYMTWRP